MGLIYELVLNYSDGVNKKIIRKARRIIVRIRSENKAIARLQNSLFKTICRFARPIKKTCQSSIILKSWESKTRNRTFKNYLITEKVKIGYG